jgi:hypothetical protein
MELPHPPLVHGIYLVYREILALYSLRHFIQYLTFLLIVIQISLYLICGNFPMVFEISGRRVIDQMHDWWPGSLLGNGLRQTGHS